MRKTELTERIGANNWTRTSDLFHVKEARYQSRVSYSAEKLDTAPRQNQNVVSIHSRNRLFRPVIDIDFFEPYKSSMTDLRLILKSTYQKRSSLNPLYSQNAFARDLGVSRTALSQFLSKKRQLSSVNLKRVAEALYLPETHIQQDSRESGPISGATQLNIDQFALISEWYHFAILNLIEFQTIKTAADITKFFEITPIEAKQTLDRLLKLSFIKKVNGVFCLNQKSLDTGTDVPSSAIRKHNREKMELAIQSLEKHSVDERDISSMSLSFNQDDMKKVKDEIRKFKKRIDKICSNKNANQVYSLNIQFFPLSRMESKK